MVTRSVRALSLVLSTSLSFVVGCGSVATKNGSGGASGDGGHAGSGGAGGSAVGTGGRAGTGGVIVGGTGGAAVGTGGLAADGGPDGVTATDGPATDGASDSGGKPDGANADTGAPDGGATCPATPTGVVSWWPGDGNYNDVAGSSVGSSAGGVTFAAGAVGQGFSLDGTVSSYIQVADAATLRIAGPITIDAWINPAASATAVTGRIVDKIMAGGANGYLLDVVSSQLRIAIGADSLSSGVAVPNALFTHVAGVYNGASLSLYMNGVLVATKTTAVAALPTSNLPLRIGADSAGANRFAGVIDEPRIFSRALSADEIQSIYQQGSVAHCSCVSPPSGLISWWRGEGNLTDARGGNNGTDPGGVAFATGAVGSGFNLTGVASAYVQVPNAASLQVAGPLTIEAWINPTTVGGRIVDKITAGGGDGYLLDVVTNQLRFVIGSDSVLSGTTNTIAAAKLTHVAGVYDGTTLSVYINGVRVANKATLVTAVPVNSLPLRIGADSTGANRTTGIIDEPRIYGRALASDEVLAIFRAGAAVRCP